MLQKQYTLRECLRKFVSRSFFVGLKKNASEKNNYRGKQFVWL
jgi:hypothetical protein